MKVNISLWNDKCIYSATTIGTRISADSNGAWLNRYEKRWMILSPIVFVGIKINMNRISNTSEYRHLILRSVWFYFVSLGLLLVITLGLFCLLIVSIATRSENNLEILGLLALISIVSGVFLLIFYPYVRDIRGAYLTTKNSIIVDLSKRSRGGSGYPGFVYEVNLATEEHLETFDKKLYDSLLLGKEYQFIYGEASKLIVVVRPIE